MGLDLDGGNAEGDGRPGPDLTYTLTGYMYWSEK
jgi:hypothetical protein